MERFTITVASDLAVVGYNPERADLDCPRGELVAEVFFLQATNARGDRREFGSFESAEEAERSIRLAPPVNLWPSGRPEYGSLAYQAYGEADQMAAEGRMEEMQATGFDTRFSIF